MLLSLNNLRRKALSNSKMNRKHRRFNLTRRNCKRYCSHVMNSNSLSAPGRMDVVEQVLAGDPFFKARLRESGTRTLRNRRGIQKRYSGLTVDLVAQMARQGLDAVNMRRDEVIAKAFEFFAGKDEAQVVA